jgi:hypothetical protein
MSTTSFVQVLSSIPTIFYLFPKFSLDFSIAIATTRVITMNVAKNEVTDIVIRPLRESDIEAADRICRLAFGTFIGLQEVGSRKKVSELAAFSNKHKSYRLYGDTWGCENCKVTGDKFHLQETPCYGGKK